MKHIVRLSCYIKMIVWAWHALVKALLVSGGWLVSTLSLPSELKILLFKLLLTFVRSVALGFRSNH